MWKIGQSSLLVLQLEKCRFFELDGALLSRARVYVLKRLQVPKDAGSVGPGH